MQPPPARKGPYLKTLKHVHTEQIARLQAKNQHECDLLEDIRNFTKQRSVIEKTYAEALLKISSAYLNKKIPSIPDLRDEEEDERWNVWNVWRTVLEENEKLARARLAAVEVFQQQITDDAKTIRHAKLQASKKCLDQLATVQKELQNSVQELDRNKKLYFEEEHLAHDARDKARDAEEKLKKKKGSIFSSFTSLQRSSVKFSNKKEACEEKSTGARNDYLIALAVANAHQDRYFNVDLDNCLRGAILLQTLEGDVYDKLKEYLTVIGRTELLTCSAAQNSFSKIRDQAQMLSRDYNVMCCVQYYPVLKQHIRYPFEACDGDNCSKITCDHGAGSLLSREAKRCATKIGKEIRNIRENQKRLFYFQQLKEAGHKNDPDDSNGPDLDTKMDEIKESIRRSETEKAKAEGIIECLRDGNVNVEEWMQDIESLTTTLDIPRSSSSNSVKTDTSGEQQQQQPMQETFYDSESNDASLENVKENEPAHRESISTSIDHEDDIDAHVEMERQRLESITATWDDPTQVDWGDEPPAAPEPVASPPVTSSHISHRDSWPAAEAEPGVVKCVALYSYTAQNPDELSIVENEHLDLIGEGDGDGWVRAKNYKGEEGYVPQNYVEVEGSSTSAGYPLQPQISFSSVDYHVQDTNNVEKNEEEEVPEPEEIAKQAEVAPISNGYPEQESDEYFPPASQGDSAAPLTSVSSGGTTPFINELRGEDEGMFCRALYDYEATAPEELSFYEGQIMRVLRTTPHNEDDGWWEGEYDGLKGLFPSVIVEECRWDGESLFPEEDEEEEEEADEDEPSDSGIAPPTYTPPEIPGHLLPPEKVIITQPTPETEQAENPPKNPAAYNYDKPNFEMELNSDQQQKYHAQFGDEPTVVITEAPEVTVTVTEPDNEIEQDKGEDCDPDSGLEVAQIVITAATPMTEEPKEFPADGEEPEKIEEDETVEPLPPPPPPPAEEPEEEPEVEQFAQFADFANNDFTLESTDEVETSGTNPEAFDPTTSDDPQVQDNNIPSASSQDSENSADTVHEQLPPPPSSAIDSSLDSSEETKKTSLDIQDSDNHTKMSMGESSESPVTPEELDIQNLAKLETLKESNA
ncbi:unnamed protein product [Allacma fusca]|uniref:F-BAR and double SH3 domains protein 2 n=1 Tax=Allacma fusca TaxID=39272 RepID=A0A8J2JU29_9HEXA|nr:unnamed protein product [Allacma fusca]